MSQAPRKPTAFKLEKEPTKKKSASSAGPKPRKPRSLPLSDVKIEEDQFDTASIPARDPVASLSRGMHWGGLVLTALGALVSLWIGLFVTELIENLFARHELLGWAGVGLLGLLGLALIVIIVRELAALLRLRTISRVQKQAALAISRGDSQEAIAVARNIRRIYRDRKDIRWGLQRLKDHETDIIDAADRIRLIERDVMVPLDAEAARIIARTARRVAVITAIVPAAALDILLVGAQNLKMLRELANLYGGKPGRAGSFRLARMVLSHLALTGGLAMTDTLIQGIIGKGLAGRLSSRLGEGTVNGILTARIGLAAMEIVRPIAFTHQAKPSLNDFIKEVLSISGDEDKKS